MSDKKVCSFFIRSKLFKECGNLSKHKTEVRKGNEKSEMVQSAELNFKTSVEGNGSNNLGNVECEQTESRINDFELVDSDEKKYVNHIIAGYREIKVETNANEHQDDDVNCNAVSKRKRGRPSKNCSDVSIKIEKEEASRETHENMSEFQENKFELKVALRKGTKRKRRKTRTHFKGVTKRKVSKDTLKAENEKPARVQCTVCEKLVRPKNLKRHRATHDRPYKCSVCGRKCRDERRYEVHMASHTGGKPYSCETCGRCFSTSGKVYFIITLNYVIFTIISLQNVLSAEIFSMTLHTQRKNIDTLGRKKTSVIRTSYAAS